mgnify:CR=1 FL=1
MENKVIAEGKTTNEAIENGLKILKVSKNKVNIKVLENEDKRSFFSILTPRVVKVELTLKEETEDKKEVVKKNVVDLTVEEQNKAKENVDNFLKDWIQKLSEDIKYSITESNNGLKVELNGDNIGYLIGYRGETLYSIQNILSSIAGKGINNRVRVILDIEGYKEKREKTLEDLAQKVASTVIKTKKPVKLEAMTAYERKIIHSKLQENNKIETHSVGEEPNRRIVISYKK